MKSTITLCLCLFLISMVTSAQEARYYLTAGGSYSEIKILEIDEPTPNYSTKQFTVGMNMKKGLTESISIHTGLQVGLMIMRESYISGNITSQPNVDSRLNASVSDANKYFLAIPLSIQYNPIQRVGLRSGFLFRAWSPDNKTVDVLSSYKEFGFIGGISGRVSGKVSVFGHYFRGINSLRINPKAVHKFYMVGIEYDL